MADFIIALDHSIISPLWLVWVRAPHGSQVRQVKFYLWVCQVVFPGVLPFSPHLLIGSSRYEWNNLERDVKLKKKKKKNCFLLTKGHEILHFRIKLSEFYYNNDFQQLILIFIPIMWCSILQTVVCKIFWFFHWWIMMPPYPSAIPKTEITSAK